MVGQWWWDDGMPGRGMGGAQTTAQAHAALPQTLQPRRARHYLICTLFHFSVNCLFTQEAIESLPDRYGTAIDHELS
jgi:hypothetical protein